MKSHILKLSFFSSIRRFWLMYQQDHELMQKDKTKNYFYFKFSPPCLYNLKEVYCNHTFEQENIVNEENPQQVIGLSVVAHPIELSNAGKANRWTQIILLSILSVIEFATGFLVNDIFLTAIAIVLAIVFDALQLAVLAISKTIQLATWAVGKIGTGVYNLGSWLFSSKESRKPKRVRRVEPGATDIPATTPLNTLDSAQAGVPTVLPARSVPKKAANSSSWFPSWTAFKHYTGMSVDKKKQTQRRKVKTN